MKAFLSHSSRDKQFVRAVALELGRQFCLFDEQTFETGEEFKSSIERYLDESSTFVLFASEHARASIWVDFEIGEAWYRRLHKTLNKSLVYLIDASLDVESLPNWLRRALIRRENSPKVVARDIRHHLNKLLVERQRPYFIGRSRETSEVQKALTPLDGSMLPHAIFITGLPGIGRRSLVKHAAPTILNLEKFVEIPVGEEDSVNDLCISIADYVEPYNTKERFERIFAQIKALAGEDALQRTLVNLRTMTQAGELPILLDDGGLLDGEGYVREPVEAILRSLKPDDQAYVFLVSSRRPKWKTTEWAPQAHVEPLEREEVRRLVSLLATRAMLAVSPDQLTEFAEYVAGYPPAAYFAVEQAKGYGLELLLRDKKRLVEFRTGVFLKHFSKLSLSSNEQALLRVLAAYSPLPLPIILEVLSVELGELQKMILHLIDLSLVIPTERGHYRIADPVADAAVRAFGFPSDQENKSVAHKLYDFLQQSEIAGPLLQLSRVAFRAARWAEDETLAQKALHLSNDLIKLTETLYHARKYDDAVKLGYMAIDERPESLTGRSYLIRALIQEERWLEAERQIAELHKYAPPREVHFLRGFLERRRGNIPGAIKEYEKSEQLGRKGVAISRELAACHYHLGDLDKASMRVKDALLLHGDNPHVVDLWAQIATAQGDEPTAREALSRHELIGEPVFYYHRLSRVELAFGRPREAQAAARTAVEECEGQILFHVLANLAYCELEVRDAARAEELLSRLDREFGHIRHDIRIGLRCRLEIIRGHWGKALSMSQQIQDKHTVFYKRITRDALSGELLESALEDEVRANYEKELAILDAELAGTKQDRFGPSELDIRAYGG